MQGLRKQADTIVPPVSASDKKSGAYAARGPATAPPYGHRRLLPAWRVWLRLIAISALLAVFVGADWQAPPNALLESLRSLTSEYRFDLVTWEVEAIKGKVADSLHDPAEGLGAEESRSAVLNYLRLAQRAGALEDEIERIYADPAVAQPELATKAQRAELAAIRHQLEEQASTVEAILEEQLARQVAAAGLTTVGLAWPPPRLRFTEPPQLLVVSPRERIQRLASVDLQPTLDSADRDRLEAAVAGQDNLSAYVTPVGGYGAWPTMVVDRFDLPWTLETIAHEWVHNYLIFHPLGWSYLSGGDSITINETVADIVGEELGRAVLESYYPDLVPLPQPEPSTPSEVTATQQPDEPPPFDFGREMRATRLAVDALLEKGYVAEAEALMEARRQRFIEHGYRLRVLNQAYFAFHGSYATGPAATDPIGPKLVRLRGLSPSLADFLHLVDGMTSVADIDAALERLGGDG